jgi:hypothetical protein
MSPSGSEDRGGQVVCRFSYHHFCKRNDSSGQVCMDPFYRRSQVREWARSLIQIHVCQYRCKRISSSAPLGHSRHSLARICIWLKVRLEGANRHPFHRRCPTCVTRSLSRIFTKVVTFKPVRSNNIIVTFLPYLAPSCGVMLSRQTHAGTDNHFIAEAQI